MKPGLHALTCSRCGAPLDPTEKAKGSVVTCEHCGQPHLWVAPGRVEAKPSPTLATRPGSKKGPLLLGLAIVALVVLVGMGAGAWLVLGRRAPADMNVQATAEMPIAIGDTLHMQIDNHGCEVQVQDVLADGRLLGVACGAQEPSPLARSLLTVDAFPENQSWSNPEAGDIVLAKSGASWERRAVVGPEPGKQFRVRPLVDGKGKEEVVGRSTVLRVQRASSGDCWLKVPLSGPVPLEAGDVLTIDEGTIAHSVTVVRDLGDSVAVQKSGEGEQTRKKSALSGRAVCARSSLKPDSPVLVKDGGKWLRRRVVSDEGTFVQLKDPGSGSAESRAKQDMIRLAN